MLTPHLATKTDSAHYTAVERGNTYPGAVDTVDEDKRRRARNRLRRGSSASISGTPPGEVGGVRRVQSTLQQQELTRRARPKMVTMPPNSDRIPTARLAQTSTIVYTVRALSTLYRRARIRGYLIRPAGLYRQHIRPRAPAHGPAATTRITPPYGPAPSAPRHVR